MSWPFSDDLFFAITPLRRQRSLSFDFTPLFTYIRFTLAAGCVHLFGLWRSFGWGLGLVLERRLSNCSLMGKAFIFPVIVVRLVLHLISSLS